MRRAGGLTVNAATINISPVNAAHRTQGVPTLPPLSLNLYINNDMIQTNLLAHGHADLVTRELSTMAKLM